LTSQAESPTNTQYGVNGVDFSHPAQWGLFLAIGLLAVITVSPLVWMVSAAFKEPNEIFVPTLLPKSPTLANFRYVFSQLAFLRSVLNTFFVAGTITAVALLFHSMAAFALARLRFPGRDVIFLGIFSTLLVSFPVIIVPSFMLVRQMGMVNSYAGLIVPAIFNAFGIFLLRQFYISIPRELQEAAIIDGASYWQIYWTVILPLSRPILAALAVFLFLANWNSFLWPLTITTDEELWLVQVAIATFHDEYAAQWNYVVAASTVVASPTLILFFLFQQKLIEAIKISALK
jgi:multiple sugar transport system permease protein